MRSRLHLQHCARCINQQQYSDRALFRSSAKAASRQAQLAFWAASARASTDAAEDSACCMHGGPTCRVLLAFRRVQSILTLPFTAYQWAGSSECALCRSARVTHAGATKILSMLDRQEELGSVASEVSSPTAKVSGQHPTSCRLPAPGLQLHKSHLTLQVDSWRQERCIPAAGACRLTVT